MLKLSSLRIRHPHIGAALFHEFAASTIVRLSMEPTPLPGSLSRDIEVNWFRRPGRGSEEAVRRCIGWDDCYDDALRKICEQLPFTRNGHAITEAAAIGVAALLIHDLETGELRRVLPIGSDGDYFVHLSGESALIKFEVGGLQMDKTGSNSRAVLRKKAEQVLRHARVGFVSVTTFCHGDKAVAHAYQHFVKTSHRHLVRKRSGKKRGKR